MKLLLDTEAGNIQQRKEPFNSSASGEDAVAMAAWYPEELYPMEMLKLLM